MMDRLTDENATLKYQVNDLSEQLANRGSNEETMLTELQGELARHKVAIDVGLI